MVRRLWYVLVCIGVTACGGGGGSGSSPAIAPPTATAAPTATPNPQANFYQPLAVGDSWSYSCSDIKGGGANGGLPFTKTNAIIGTTTVNGTLVYEFALQIPQIPSTPVQIVTQIQLLANDALGNLTLYGYLVNAAVSAITPTLFVSATTPATRTPFNYLSPAGLTIDRFFFGVTNSNPTALGTFRVAPYFESSSTHNYGYAAGVGIVEEDHGPNFEVDCLLSVVTLK